MMNWLRNNSCLNHAHHRPHILYLGVMFQKKKTTWPNRAILEEELHEEIAESRIYFPIKYDWSHWLGLQFAVRSSLHLQRQRQRCRIHSITSHLSLAMEPQRNHDQSSRGVVAQSKALKRPHWASVSAVAVISAVRMPWSWSSYNTRNTQLVTLSV